MWVWIRLRLNLTLRMRWVTVALNVEWLRVRYADNQQQN
jgi:hypothetical protein